MEKSNELYQGDAPDRLPATEPAVVPTQRILSLRVNLDDVELIKKLRATDAYWDARQRVWRVSAWTVERLGLEEYVV